MKQEFISIRERETTARVQTTSVQAVRLKDITRKGVRVYNNGNIGVSGTIGETSESFLLDSAIQNLDAGISYPYPLSRDNRDHRTYNAQPTEAKELLDYAETILAVLRDEYPDFSFSEMVSATETIYRMHNSEGLDLEYNDAYVMVQLILKEKATANLFDGFLGCISRRFELNKFLDFNRQFLEAYRNKVELPTGDILPVFSLETSGVLSFIGRSLHGERFAKGSSLYSGKMGELLFSERLNIELLRDPQSKLAPFFDFEGVVLPNDRLNVIEQGRLTGVLTDKKTAQIYNLPHTGAATGSYDDPPTIDGAHGRSLAFKTDSKDIVGFLNGQPAIFVLVSSGGDFTADGNFASPVQVSFLFDGQRLLGKLPEFTMRSHINNMLGKDYIGTFDNDKIYMGDVASQLQGYYMKILD